MRRQCIDASPSMVAMVTGQLANHDVVRRYAHIAIELGAAIGHATTPLGIYSRMHPRHCKNTHPRHQDSRVFVKHSPLQLRSCARGIAR